MGRYIGDSFIKYYIRIFVKERSPLSILILKENAAIGKDSPGIDSGKYA